MLVSDIQDFAIVNQQMLGCRVSCVGAKMHHLSSNMESPLFSLFCLG